MTLPGRRHTRGSAVTTAGRRFSVYVTGKVLEWVEEQGGVEEMARRSADKAKLVYSTADESEVRTAELASRVAIHSGILSGSSLCFCRDHFTHSSNNYTT